MSELKAIRFRIAAKWLIFGSFIIGLLACVIRLVLYLNNLVNFDRYTLPNGTKLPLPLDMIVLIGVVLILMLIGLVLLIVSARIAKASESEAELLAGSDPSESAYIEEDLPTAETDPGEESSALPEETAVARRDEEACACRRRKAARKGSAVKKAALVAIPVAIAVVATAVTTAALVKSVEDRRHAKNRRRFYDWLG